MTFGSRVTQRGEGFEVQALYIENIKDNSPKSFRWGQVDCCPAPPPLHACEREQTQKPGKASKGTTFLDMLTKKTILTCKIPQGAS